MKTSYRSGFLSALTVSVGLLAALLAGGCAAPDDVEADGAAAEALGGVEETTEEASAAEEASVLHVASHAAGCRCGICTGGRHAHEAR
ncbi:MAG: hypothetical protein MUF34_10475 [Polyangiaceae bacterium]|jgi:hypothetical protein|nr:hypothetical protein [Polyangiaceae bacterium]